MLSDPNTKIPGYKISMLVNKSENHLYICIESILQHYNVHIIPAFVCSMTVCQEKGNEIGIYI